MIDESIISKAQIKSQIRDLFCNGLIGVVIGDVFE